jgi:cobalt-precorrin 5A hydrolase
MKPLIAGIGCRRGVSAEALEAAIRAALAPHTLDQLGAVATLDTKADEPGLVAFCARHALRLQSFTREQIAAVPGTRTSAPSAVARAQFGVDGVCEPCALLAAGASALVAPKRRYGDVTVALARIATASVDNPLELNHQDPR